MQFPLVYTGNRVTIEKLSDRLYFRQGDLNADVYKRQRYSALPENGRIALSLAFRWAAMARCRSQ